MEAGIKIWNNLIFPAVIVLLLYGSGTYINKISTHNTEQRIYKQLLESSRTGGTVAIRDAKGKVVSVRVRKAW